MSSDISRTPTDWKTVNIFAVIGLSACAWILLGAANARILRTEFGTWTLEEITRTTVPTHYTAFDRVSEQHLKEQRLRVRLGLWLVALGPLGTVVFAVTFIVGGVLSVYDIIVDSITRSIK